MTGALYLVATPIGNLEDMTCRAVNTLREADVIAAEDTRRTRQLLSHFDLHTPLISYHEHNKSSRGGELLARLLGGDAVALVSDAGLPCVSDPGADLVSAAVAAGVRVVPIPGANAALTALVASGLSPQPFTFCGFLPRASRHQRELLNRLRQRPETLIFYEAPHRIRDTLALLAAVFGDDRPCALARELTKVHEEFLRGTLAAVSARLGERDCVRGEFVLVVAGCADQAVAGADDEAAAPLADPAALLRRYLADGALTRKEAVRRVAVECNLSRRDVYRLSLELTTSAADHSEVRHAR